MTEIPRPGPGLARALEHLRAGEWQAAHEIVQKDESTLSSWLHGIVHLLEGDMKNAQGWYTRAARPFPTGDAGGKAMIQAEITAASRALQSGAPS